MVKINKNEYISLLTKLKQEIVSARQKAYQTANRQLVELYFNIGRSIYEKVEISKPAKSSTLSITVSINSSIVEGLE